MFKRSNKALFIALLLLFVAIVSVFIYFIAVEVKKGNVTYEVKKDSVVYDYENNYIKTSDDSVINLKLNSNYYLSYNEDNSNISYRLGTTTVVYNANDYKISLIGPAYKINTDGSVEKLSGLTEIIKGADPTFYKISDRKYLFVDKTMATDDNSIKTSDYVIIELDKNGNASFFNYELAVKTVKPLILKGSSFDFDIANEKIINLDSSEIDLKSVIGSSNTYTKSEETTDEDNTDTNDSNDQTQTSNTDYYNEYLNKIKDSFNNLYESIGTINESTQEQIVSQDKYIDLTRWLVLKSVVSYTSSLTINYTVFDPNNEYQEVFLILSGSGVEDKRIQLSKASTENVINNLLPDTEYNISLGYRLVSAVGDSSVDVISDSLQVKTLQPNYKISITKITSTKIYYKVTFDKTYKPDSVTINISSDGSLLDSTNITSNNIDSNMEYSGTFDFKNLGYIVELNISNVIYDGTLVDVTASTKFVN